MRQILFLASFVFFLIFSGCAGSQNSHSGKHRKPVSTGKRKCGCSLLTPDSKHTIKLYQSTYYVLQA
jgi:hypothetical protein